MRSLCVEQIDHCLAVVDEHGALAGIAHCLIVLHHIGHLGYAHKHRLVVGLRLGYHLQLVVGRKQLAGTYERLRQIVAHLKVFAQLQGMAEAADGMAPLPHLHGFHAVVLQYVEVAGRRLLLFLLGGFLLTSEKSFKKVHLGM